MSVDIKQLDCSATSVANRQALYLEIVDQINALIDEKVKAKQIGRMEKYFRDNVHSIAVTITIQEQESADDQGIDLAQYNASPDNVRAWFDAFIAIATAHVVSVRKTEDKSKIAYVENHLSELSTGHLMAELVRVRRNKNKRTTVGKVVPLAAPATLQKAIEASQGKVGGLNLTEEQAALATRLEQSRPVRRVMPQLKKAA